MHEVFSVGQITARLRELIEGDLVLADAWISGEVSNLKRYPSGHLYFSLKDGPPAVLSCVLFKSDNAGFVFDDGDQVVAHGRVSLYEQRGQLQFIVDFVQPEGVGALQAEFERLKAKLREQGLFDPARKRPLPRFPQRVGVVTSSAGAVFHDICHVLERRWPLAELVLAPTAVQGAEAPPRIVSAIETLDRQDLDVMIVARGGGSLEEIWAFNDERVARAIFGSRTPVVSGVGHETDVTIADLVADVRAPTPSAAAELVGPDRTEVSVRLSVAAGSLLSRVQRCVEDGRGAMVTARTRIDRGLPDITRERQRADDLTRLAMASVDRVTQRFHKGLHGFGLALRSLDPYATLQRGYALVQRDGHVVDTVAEATVGERLNVRVRDGDFPVRVDSGRPVSDRARRRRAAVAAEQASLFSMEAS